MELKLRKFTKFVDKTFVEGGKKAKEPVLLVSVAAVFTNPWDGQGYVEDLKPTILDLAPKLGDLLVPELIKEIGSPEKILAYGKAGIVGLNVYDLYGRQIKTITKFFHQAGASQLSWNAENGNGKNVASGAYIYELVYDQKSVRGKIVYIK